MRSARQQRLGTCALLALCLVGCGHGTGTTTSTESGAGTDLLPPVVVDASGSLLEAESVQALGLTAAGELVVPAEGVSGPARRFRPGDRTPAEGALLTKAYRKAKATGQLGLTLESDVTWAQVRKVLSKCVSYPYGRCDVHVALKQPGGTLQWTTFKACARPAGVRARVGLLITLRGTPAQPHTRVDSLGSTWPRARGCDEELLADSVANWGDEARTLWSEWLQELDQLVPADAPRRLALKAGRRVPARAVLALLDTVHAGGLGEVDLSLHARRSFRDPVDKALRWLEAHQSPEGNWAGDSTRNACDDTAPAPKPEDTTRVSGRTGLALLAFLGAGYTNRGKHPFATCVAKGLRYLKRVQQPNGQFGAPDASTATGDHAWAAWAMLEAYRRTGSPIYKVSALQALKHLQSSPLPAAEDMLTLLPTALALHTARGINRDLLARGKPVELAVRESSLQDALLEARRVSPRGDGTTAAAFFVRTVLDEEERKAPDVVRGLRVLLATIDERGGATDPVVAWCGGGASKHVSNEAFKRWTQIAVDPLLLAQRGGAHACCATGSWDPPAGMAPAQGGRLAATVLLCLAFQTFHRYGDGHVGR